MESLQALGKWLYGETGGRGVGNAQEWVGSLEGRYGIRLPEDFRRYLIEVAPFQEVFDDAQTTWWPLDRIRSIPDEYQTEIGNPAIAGEAGTYLFFADYIFWCWAWAVCCSEGPNRGRVAFIGGPDGFVADSFLEFVERYLADPDAMATSMPQRTRGDA